MTSLSYLEAMYGCHKETLSKAEAADYADQYAKHYADLRFEYFKEQGAKIGRTYNSDEWFAKMNFEEQRKHLPK